MPKYTNQNDPLFLEQRDKLLSHCTQVIFSPKSSKSYQEHMNALVEICANLATTPGISCGSIASQMHDAMIKASEAELEMLKAKLVELKEARTGTPLTRMGFFSSSEAAIKKLTETKLDLEKRQNLPYKEIINEIIYQTFQLVGKNGINVPDLSDIELKYSVSPNLEETSPSSPQRG